ncbi:MAG: DUF2797 domain-containing protein [Pseudomonadales bacterium]|nr:DUF2797 domain-containing protein [Pseudomonadales bacterium]
MPVIGRGQMRKMQARLDDPVSYSLPLGSELVPLNDFLGHRISLHFSGSITCIHCGRKTAKSFNQGYCFPCFQKLAECDGCVMAPEKCHYERGTCRDPVWGEEFCMQDHIVYIANSSGIKVGITRASQVPTRWIDQGAVQALAVLRVRSRQQSGFAEVMFKQHVSDRTNWRSMLKGDTASLDLMAERDRLLSECASGLADLQQQFGLHAISVINGVDVVAINYPVLNHPETVNAFNFDTDATVEGLLLGIKGQYLIFADGVINIRKFTAYDIELSDYGKEIPKPEQQQNELIF